MKFQLALLAPIFTFLAMSAVEVSGKTSTACVSECFRAAASTAGCAISNHGCFKQSSTFETAVQQCLVTQKCTSLAEGTAADLDAASDVLALHAFLRPGDQRDSLDNRSTTLSRVTAKRSALTSLESAGDLSKRACNSGDNICVLSASRCNTYCARCHVAGSGCKDCSGGICSGFLGLTCTCQTPCVTCG
ncbi:hypothetical protein DFP72DRAFT_1016749 [Ephemerocybe angulata]|uniref:Extracellular membrane protein CFEM domain-containing protein n=1 Tax=Ephemerocybe angulata TaxID=980116 RepID=A0A8H6HJD6_9AGAR|nr:hypothetical protein DFP72DRAFT_1016749 [Tulosesus angulatus]